jgi:hypothetical protein
MMYGGNSQTVYAGLRFWLYPEKLDVQPAAYWESVYGYLGTLVADVVANTAPAIRYQQSVNQFTNLTYTGGDTQISNLAANVATFIRILGNVGNSAPAPLSLIGEPTAVTVSSGTITVVYPTVTSAGITLQTIRTAIQNQKIGAVFTASISTNSLVISSSIGGTGVVGVGDIITGVGVPNDTAIISGSGFNFVINRVLTVASRSMTTGLVEGSLNYINATYYVINDPTTNSIITELFGVITDLIENGIDARQAISLVNPTGLLAENAQAQTLLLSNITTIQNSFATYFNNQFPGSGYNVNATKQAIGYLLEAIACDLTYGGNSASIAAARSFISSAAATGLGLANDYAAALAGNLSSVIQTLLGNQLASDLIATISTIVGATTIGESVAGGYNVLTVVTISGPNVTTVTYNIITPTISTLVYDKIYISARNIINSNISTITNKTIVHLLDTYRGQFNYNESTCYRDLGYILDAMVIDLLVAGNYQSVNAGLSYYKNASARVAIGVQLKETLDGITFAFGDGVSTTQGLVYAVLNNTAMARYQNLVQPTPNLTKTPSVAAINQYTNNIAITLNIINLGISAAPTPNFGSGYYTINFSNGGNGYVDQGTPGNVHIITGKILVGNTSNAYGLIVKYTPGGVQPYDTITVRLTQPGFFQVGEQLDYGETVQNLNITIYVESGIYYEHYPIRIPANVTISGDDFRRTIIRPLDAVSQSPWRTIFFYRDGIIDALQTGIINYTGTDYAFTAKTSLAIGGTSGQFTATLGNNVQAPANWIGLVLTEAVYSVTSATVNTSTGVVTITFVPIENNSMPAQPYIAGNNIVIEGMTPTSYNGVFPISRITVLGNVATVTLTNYQATASATAYGTISTGKAVVNTVSGNLITCSTVYPFSAVQTYGQNQWHLFNTINYGRHYLTDPLDITSGPKNNKDIDVFLCNDATRIKLLTLQGHGGFSMVLDPEGQIKTKSPYAQEGASFSRSANRKTFAGGQFIDGFAGRLFGTIIGIENNGLKITIQGSVNSGLDIRPPQTPCAFYLQGFRYQINDVVSYDSTSYTVVLTLDDSTPFNPANIYNSTSFSNNLKNIIDAANYDMVFGSNYKTTFQGISYIAPQNLVATTALTFVTQGISCAGILINALDIASVDRTSITTTLRAINNILTSGVAALPTLVFPAPAAGNTGYANTLASTLTNLTNARQILTANRSFIQSEIGAWVSSNYVTNAIADYSATKIRQDTGYIVDAICYDLLYGGNSSVYDLAQLYYVNGVGQLGASQQVYVAAFVRLASVLQSIVRNISITPSAGNLAIQKTTSYTAATTTEATTIGNLISLLIDYVGDGLFNDTVAATIVTGTTSVTLLSYSPYLTNGVTITGIGIPTGTTIGSINFTTGTAVLSNPATATSVSTGGTNYDGTILTIVGAPSITRITPNISNQSYSSQSDFSKINAQRIAIAASTVNYISNGAGIGINIEMGGNKTMLSNDFTQVNDLGYGILVTNGAGAEAVSAFTYYNYVSYWALNGGQIRSVAGSSGYGVYGLRASGSDVTELPNAVNLSNDMVQIARVYKQGIYSSTQTTATNQNLTVYIRNYEYIPQTISELEIDHSAAGGGIVRYLINTVTHTSVYVNQQNILALGLSTQGTNNTSSTGLNYNLYDGQHVIIRGLQNFKFYNITNVQPVRPSTALQYSNNLGAIYRIVSYNLTNSTGEQLPANTAVLTIDTSFSYYYFSVDNTSIQNADPVNYNATAFVAINAAGNSTSSTILTVNQVTGTIAIGQALGGVGFTKQTVQNIVTNTFTSTGSTINTSGRLQIGVASGAPAIGQLLTGSGLTGNGIYITAFIPGGGTGDGSFWQTNYSGTAISAQAINGTSYTITLSAVPTLTPVGNVIFSAQTQGASLGDSKIAVLSIQNTTILNQINVGTYITSWGGKVFRVISYTQAVTASTGLYSSDNGTTIVLTSFAGSITNGQIVTGSGFDGTQYVVSSSVASLSGVQTATIILNTAPSSTPTGIITIGIASNSFLTIDPNAIYSLSSSGTSVAAMTFYSQTLAPASNTAKYIIFNIPYSAGAVLPPVDSYLTVSGQSNTNYNGTYQVVGITNKTQITVSSTSSLFVGMVISYINTTLGSSSLVSITPSSPSAGYVTIAFAAQTGILFPAGSVVVVSGVTGVTAYNGNYTVTSGGLNYVTFASNTTGVGVLSGASLSVPFANILANQTIVQSIDSSTQFTVSPAAWIQEGAQISSSQVATLASITVTSGGSGYTSPPTITIGSVNSGGALTQAIAVAILAGGSIQSVTIVSPGYGYTSLPDIIVSSQPGATAAILTPVLTSNVTVSTVASAGVNTVQATLLYTNDPGTSGNATAANSVTAASSTAFISGTTLTVPSTTSGSFATGMYLSGGSIPTNSVYITAVNATNIVGTLSSAVVSTTGTVGSIKGALLQGSTTFTAAGTSVTAAATYTAVSQSATSGSGSGAVFTIQKTGAGTVYSGNITVTITTAGTGYAIGSTVTIPGASLGGATPTNDLTLTVATALGSPWTATVTGMSSVAKLVANVSTITATNGVGALYGGSPSSVTVATIGTNSITYTVVDGTTPVAGSITNLTGSGITLTVTSGTPPSIGMVLVSGSVTAGTYIVSGTGPFVLSNGSANGSGITIAATSYTVSSSLSQTVTTITGTNYSVTLSTLNNLSVGNQIIFTTPSGGSALGNIISGTTYYIIAIDSTFNQVVISSLYNGSVFNPGRATSVMTFYSPSFGFGGSISGIYFTSKTYVPNTSTYSIVLSFTTTTAPTIGAYYYVSNNTNNLYNGYFLCTDSSSTSITLQYPFDPGVFSIATATSITVEVTRATSNSLGLSKPFSLNSQPSLRLGYAAAASGQITIKISTCRATGHDFLNIGTGGYNTSNYPTQIYGNPAIAAQSSNQIVEETVGRVFYVTTDENGIFRVGRFFSVDQGTGTVTFSASIALSNLDGLGFKRGVVVSSFSTDGSMAENASDVVPVQSAIRSFVDSRLGLTYSGSPTPTSNLIGPGFLSLDGSLAMKGNINAAGFTVSNLASPFYTTDAANKAYVDAGAAAYNNLYRLNDTAIKATGTYLSLGVSGGSPPIYTVTLTNVYGSIVPGMVVTGSGFTGGQTVLTVNITTVSAVLGGSGTITISGNYNSIPTGSPIILTFTTQTSGNLLVYTGSKWVNASASGGNISIVYSPGTGGATGTLAATINSSTIVDSMISSSAAIQQSKLALQAATTLASAPGSYTQSSLGLAAFNNNVFTASQGWVDLLTSSNGTTGIQLSKITQISAGTLLGNLGGVAASPTAVTPSAVVAAAGGILNSSFASTGIMNVLYNGTSTSGNTYGVTPISITNAASSIVQSAADKSVDVGSLKVAGSTIITATSGNTVNFSTPNAATGTTYFMTSTGTTVATTTTYGTFDTSNGTLKATTITTGAPATAGTITGNYQVSALSTIDFYTNGATLKTGIITTGSPTNTGTITGLWSLSGTGTQLQATYSDLAEWYRADAEYAPGTVLVFGGDAEVTTTKIINDTRAAGIVTTEPAYTMNGELQGTRACLALAGRVPCLVVGRAKKGDMLTTSATPGHAVKANTPTLGAIIGKALEDKDYGEAGVIEVAVGRI